MTRNYPFCCCGQRNIANKFAGDFGLILTFEAPETERDGTVMYFACDPFSKFDTERERLFMGAKLKIKNIKFKGKNQARFLEPINAFNHLLSGQPLGNQSILTKQQHRKKHLLALLSNLLSKMISRSATRSDISEYVGKLMWFTHSNSPHVRLLYDEIMETYDWLHCILKCNNSEKSGNSGKSEKSDTIDIANIAVLCRKSDEISIEMAGRHKLEEAEWRVLTKGMQRIHELGLSMRIRIQLWPTESDWDRMYQMAFSLAKENGIHCRQQMDDRRMLIFDRDEQIQMKQHEATDNLSLLKNFEEHVGEMITSLSEHEKLMKQQEQNKETEMVELVKDEVVWRNGKKFYYWNAWKRHDDFVEASHDDLENEVLNSKVLSQMLSKQQWNKLMKDVEKMINEKAAKTIVSNGFDEHIYGIPESKPFDAEHLLALKLWTDYDILQKDLYRILRLGISAQVKQIAHWARLLTETVQCFGSPVEETSTLWIPVGWTFYFSSIELELNLPVMARTSVKNLHFYIQFN